jgi:DNA-binding PadR family transcriptional regulator
MIDNWDMPAPPLTPATFHILVVLADGPSHGYAIKRAVEDRTGGTVRLGPGTLYAALARMTDAGLVRAHAPGRQAHQAGPPSPTYSLTTSGRAALASELARLEGDVRLARQALGRRGTAL